MDLESQLALAADEPAVESFLEAHGGRLHRPSGDSDNGTRWLELTSFKAPGEKFFARVEWSSYHRPPSVRFTPGVNDAIDLHAWPRIPGYRPENNDICKHFTAEGYATHPEWETGPSAWSPEGNPFLYVAQTLQDDLDLHYEGRAA